jgi:hypothetical protein
MRLFEKTLFVLFISHVAALRGVSREAVTNFNEGIRQVHIDDNRKSFSAIAGTLLLTLTIFGNPGNAKAASYDGISEIFGSPRGSIAGAKESLDNLDRQLSPETNLNKVYEEIDVIIRSYRLTENTRLLATEASLGNKDCADGAAEKAMYDLNTIREYFSISNDGRKKVMISDAYPGQKLNFIRQGLQAVKGDLQRLMFCAN